MVQVLNTVITISPLLPSPSPPLFHPTVVSTITTIIIATIVTVATLTSLRLPPPFHSRTREDKIVYSFYLSSIRNIFKNKKQKKSEIQNSKLKLILFFKNFKIKLKNHLERPNYPSSSNKYMCVYNISLCYFWYLEK